MLALAALLVQVPNPAPTTKPWIWRETVSAPSEVPRPSRFGERLLVVDDIDGDRVPDLVISAPLDDASGSESGCIRVVSGAQRRTLVSVYGRRCGERFGTGLANAPDVDGDGLADFVASTADGHARVISSRTGGILEEFHDRGEVDVADLDGDGVADYLKSPAAQGGARSAEVIAVSGCDDHELYRIPIEIDDPAWAAGAEVCRLGDLDGDGTPDFAAASPGLRECRRRIGGITIFSGRTGVELRAVRGSRVDGFAIGSGLVRAGDVDGDGTDDVLTSTTGEGPLLVISSRTGEIVLTLQRRRPDEWFGFEPFADTLSVAGDLDGDGTPELAYASAFLIQVFSGRDGRPIAVLDGEFTQVVVGEGRDFDGDGVPDLPVGLPDRDEVVVLSGRGLASGSHGETVSRRQWPVLLSIPRPELPNVSCPR